MGHGTTHQHDVIIIGGGGAGLRAAIAIAQENPTLSVACVSKVYPMRSHTVTAEGGAAASIKPNDSLEDHIYDTVSGADWLADQDAVEYFVNEAPGEMIQLEHWGCPWSREPDGSVAVRPFGGMKIERTWFAADKTGFHMLHSLFQTTLKYGNIVRYDEFFATKLLIDDDGHCRGCAAIELRTGSTRAILGKSVIICTGGAGKAFPFTTNGSIKTGDGMAMAYRAGVALKDMEFIQYHPTGLPGTGILITEASRGEGGILVNKDGHRYLQDYELGEALDVSDPRHPQKRAMELGPRDKLSQCFIKERQAGRTVETKDGHVVHLDLRHLGEAKIDKQIPFVRELARSYAGIDPVHQPIPVRPVVHYVMGGHRRRQQLGHQRAGALRRRRVRVRVDQWGEPARVELADRAARFRSAGGEACGALRDGPPRLRRLRPRGTGDRRGRTDPAHLLRPVQEGRAHRDAAYRAARRHGETAPASTGTRARSKRPARPLPTCASGTGASPSTTTRTASTPN